MRRLLEIPPSGSYPLVYLAEFCFMGSRRISRASFVSHEIMGRDRFRPRGAFGAFSTAEFAVCVPCFVSPFSRRLLAFYRRDWHSCARLTGRTSVDGLTAPTSTLPIYGERRDATVRMRDCGRCAFPRPSLNCVLEATGFEALAPLRSTIPATFNTAAREV